MANLTLRDLIAMLAWQRGSLPRAASTPMPSPASEPKSKFKWTEPPDPFVELMLYIAKKSEADEKFSSTKLNKILFFADFTAYGRLGKTITGQKYQKLDYGPAPRGLVPAQRKMIEAKVCAISERLYYGRPQRRIVALREPDLSLFSGDQIAIVDEILERVRSMSATEISDKSHEFVGYCLADMKENIPPESVFLAPSRPLTPSERRHAATLRAKRKRA